MLARDALAERLAPPLTALRHGELVAIARTVRVADLEAVRADAFARGLDVRFGISLPAEGFAAIERAYREAVLCLESATPARPIVVLGDLPALEAALAGADPTARAVIAAKAAGLRALDRTDRAMAIDTIRAFAAADLTVARAAAVLHIHQNTLRHRLSRINATTGHDPRTLRGLIDLLCALETLDDDVA
jgi:sugar diacid utilization regulator